MKLDLNLQKIRKENLSASKKETQSISRNLRDLQKNHSKFERKQKLERKTVKKTIKKLKKEAQENKQKNDATLRATLERIKNERMKQISRPQSTGGSSDSDDVIPKLILFGAPLVAASLGCRIM